MCNSSRDHDPSASGGTVERVAKAIARANRAVGWIDADIYGTPYTLDDEVHNVWDLFVPEARAAIEAMRVRSADTDRVFTGVYGRPSSVTDPDWDEFLSRTHIEFSEVLGGFLGEPLVWDSPVARQPPMQQTERPGPG